MRRYLLVSLLLLAGCASAPAPLPTPTPEQAKQQEQVTIAAVKSMMAQFTSGQPIPTATYTVAQYGRYTSLLVSFNRDLPPIQQRLLALQAKLKGVEQVHLQGLSDFGQESDRAALLDSVRTMRDVLTGLRQLFHDFADTMIRDVAAADLTEADRRDFNATFVVKVNGEMAKLDATANLTVQLLDIYADMCRITEADKTQWVDSRLKFNSPDAEQKFQADVGRAKPLLDQLSAQKSGADH